MRLLLLIVSLMLLLAACQQQEDATSTAPGISTPTESSVPASQTPTPGSPSAATSTRTPTSPATSAPVSYDSISLPEREITFRVRVPENTPSDEPVYLRVLTFGDWSWSKHVQLEPEDGGTLKGKISLEEGALVRYVYDRWDQMEWGEAFKFTREAHGEAVPIENRYILVTSDLTEVNDTIETWNDLRSPAVTGVVTGLVVDAGTGKPLMDTNISIAGIHTATNYDGRFVLDGVAAAMQNLVVYRTTGDYMPTSQTIDVPADGEANLEITLNAAQPVEVTFDVALPDNTPPEATVQLVGSVYQAGALLASENVPRVGSDLALPSLSRTGEDRAVGTITLHEGTYVQYYYSIGSSSWGRERQEYGEAPYRSFIVPALTTSTTRHERVEAWSQSASVGITLHVTTPPNTDPGIPLALEMGPTHWMTRVGDHDWVFFMDGFPGNEFQFRYLLGGDGLGSDGTAGLEEGGFRRIQVPESDAVIEHVIERWEFQPLAIPLEADALSEVAFRVSVPSSTPMGAPVHLTGDTPELSDGVVMFPQPGNPWMYEVTVHLPAIEDLTYYFDRGDSGTQSPRTYSTTVEFTGHVVNDWVVRWSDAPQDSIGTRPDYMNGMYTPDFWSSHFLRLSPSTYGDIAEHNGGWVTVSSVWSYGRINPLPLMEPRMIESPSVLTPREDIIAQANIARENGLKVFLAPQFNMEMGAGGFEALSGVKSAEWWNTWTTEAERLWLWNATVAEEIGAEALMLPGYVFHVFSDEWAYDPPEYIEEFDTSIAQLVGKVRQIYGGKVIISGGVTSRDFPGLADFVGVTTYDTGRPELPYDATVDQWRDGYEELFAEKVDPIHERWGKPVAFYSVHAPLFPDNPVPADELAQARQLEGFFQAVSSRPWIVGSFSWAYHMVPAPLNGDDGIRGRLAEAVFAKYYGQFLGVD